MTTEFTTDPLTLVSVAADQAQRIADLEAEVKRLAPTADNVRYTAEQDWSGLIGWAAIALLAGQAIREAVDEVRDWRALRKRKPCRPRQLGTCVTGEQACHECMLGDGYCRKEVCHNPD